MANRAFFEREMEKYGGQASVGLMIFDLDGLKLATILWDTVLVTNSYSMPPV